MTAKADGLTDFFQGWQRRLPTQVELTVVSRGRSRGEGSADGRYRVKMTATWFARYPVTNPP